VSERIPVTGPRWTLPGPMSGTLRLSRLEVRRDPDNNRLLGGDRLDSLFVRTDGVGARSR
jgi:hypothetical protein